MKLFNHKIEYLPTYLYDGAGELYRDCLIKGALIEYDDLVGNRRSLRFDAPESIWTAVKIGGTASTGCTYKFGVVIGTMRNSYRVVSPDCEDYYELAHEDENLQLGQKVVIFDKTDYETGDIIKVITPRLDIIPKLNLHSINILVDHNGSHKGLLRVDPFNGVVSSDELNLVYNGRRWHPNHFSYKLRA